MEGRGCAEWCAGFRRAAPVLRRDLPRVVVRCPRVEGTEGSTFIVGDDSGSVPKFKGLEAEPAQSFVGSAGARGGRKGWCSGWWSDADVAGS